VNDKIFSCLIENQSNTLSHLQCVHISEVKMSAADGANSNNTSKTDEYIKLRVVGQDNS
jgi:hypothetical protein